jgi:hypothetical protein
MNAKHFISYLCAALLAAPSPVWAASPPAPPAKAGLTCVADYRNKTNPYHRMKEANDQKIRQSIRLGGLEKKQPLPRQDMMALVNSDLGKLCAKQEKLAMAGANISLQKGKLEAASAGPQGCEAYNAYSAELKTFDALVKEYQSELETSIKELGAKYHELIKKEHVMLASEFDRPNMPRSFRLAWGITLGDTLTDTTSKQGVISNQRRLIQEEGKANEARQEEYKGLAQTLESLKTKCPSIGDEGLLAGAQPGEQPEPGTLPENAPVPEPSPAGDDVVPPAGPETPEGPVDEKKGGIGEWASKNKGVLILGAGAAAVGGLLWYKNKKDKEDSDIPAPPLGSGGGGSTATVTVIDTSTITDANGYTLSASGFPSGAVAGQTIGTIVVTVSGPSGGKSPDGVKVTLGCVSSCPISGTLTRTVSGGKAEFNDISFTSAKAGVQLKVSAPNINGITSPGSFNVTSE